MPFTYFDTWHSPGGCPIAHFTFPPPLQTAWAVCRNYLVACVTCTNNRAPVSHIAGSKLRHHAHLRIFNYLNYIITLLLTQYEQIDMLVNSIMSIRMIVKTIDASI